MTAPISIDASQIITIARNVTGRVDSSDPLFTDTIMLEYLNQFIQLQAPQDVRLSQQQSWWEFTLPASQDTYNVDLLDLNGDGSLTVSTIGPPAYCEGFRLFWFQDPGEFYYIWPETQTYQEQRPTYVLYYNNILTFRGPPDDDYDIKIATSKNLVVLEGTTELDTPYLYRYFAYGMSLDIFSDFGEMDKYSDIWPVFKRYRGLVYARTWDQFIPMRTIPEF